MNVDRMTAHEHPQFRVGTAAGARLSGEGREWSARGRKSGGGRRVSRRVSQVRLVAVGILALAPGPVFALQSPAAPADSSPPSAVAKDPTVALQDQELRALERLLTAIVARETGLQWERYRNWGQQERIWAGVRLRRDNGGKLETERVWREVNHGIWQHYAASLRAESGSPRISVTRFAQHLDQPAEFALSIEATVDLAARQSDWRRGVQLYSLSASGWARIEARIEGTIALAPDLSQGVPGLRVEPVVTAAAIELRQLQLDRISKLGGEFSQQAGRLARQPVNDALAERQTELVERLNREIARHRDDLRISTAALTWPAWLTRASGDSGTDGRENSPSPGPPGG